MKVLTVLFAGALLTAATAANISRAQSDEFERKLARIVQQGESRSERERPTTVTESEVNSYLHYKAGDQLPVGVTDPSIGIAGQGRLNGRAVVDLDAVRRKKGSGSLFDPMSYLTGRLPVTASGILTTADGKGRFELETAAISGIPIPKTLLQEIVSYYTRTDDNPNGIRIDDPFDLPVEIKRIDVEEGRAVVVQ
jgi:hypothetical protein